MKILFVRKNTADVKNVENDLLLEKLSRTVSAERRDIILKHVLCERDHMHVVAALCPTEANKD